MASDLTSIRRLCDRLQVCAAELGDSGAGAEQAALAEMPEILSLLAMELFDIQPAARLAAHKRLSNVMSRWTQATQDELAGYANDLRGLLADEPELLIARVTLSRILLKTGDSKGSVSALEEGVRLDPGSVRLRSSLAFAFISIPAGWVSSGGLYARSDVVDGRDGHAAHCDMLGLAVHPRPRQE